MPLNLQYYSTFGSPMPTRQWSNPNSQYKFGFNGKEKDEEINVNGGDYDFGARIYDSRLGRWLARDPLESTYPSFSSYNYSLCNPIFYEDIQGMGVKVTIDRNTKDEQGRIIVKVTSNIYVYTDVAGIQNDINCHVKLIETSIENEWNNPQVLNADGTVSPSTGNAELTSNGEKYVFLFDVNVIATTRVDAEKIAGSNIDLSNNFMELIPGEGGSARGGNTGFLPISGTDRMDAKVYAHEFGHLMGFLNGNFDNPEVAKAIKKDINSSTAIGCLENMQHIVKGDRGWGISIMSTNQFQACGNITLTINTEVKFINTSVITADFNKLNFGQGLLGSTGSDKSSGAQSPGLNQTKSGSGIFTKIISWFTKDTNVLH